ncbi:MAG: glycosyltransferase family 2 protein [Desulfobacterota bacterium]|nr:glycosyltransferase family 2 protein [Thermodesulfobacteriota bacterium]
MDISFIIVNWNTKALLLDCLASIKKTVHGLSYEIFVVDNGSVDGSAAAVRGTFGRDIHLIENSANLGFARANNQALQQTCGRYVVLLNSDTVLRNGAIATLIAFLDDHPDAAMAGPAMVDEHGTPQNSFDNFPTLATELLNKSLLRLLFPRRYAGKAGAAAAPFEVDSLIGACMAVRRSAIEQVGMLDEDYFFFLEETDWCLRLRTAGWHIYHVPSVQIVHLQGRSKKQRPARAWVEYYRSLYLFFKKHRSPRAYIVLRICRVVKLMVNFFLTTLGILMTAGLRRRFREKLPVYTYLLWWHCCGCPEHMGLRNIQR